MRYDMYNKKGYIVYEYYFENLHRFIEYISNARINTKIFDQRHLSSMKGSYNFTKTESLDEAIRLCATGWDEDFSCLLKLKERIDEKLLDAEQVNQRIKDCVGFAPCVPDFLHGNPINMWNRIYEPKYEIINIYLNIAYPSQTSSSAIYNRGAIILSLIDALEKMGYGVKLTVFELCYCENEAFLAYFNIKDETENLNMKKAYFTLCHPSFLRRVVFRLKEVTPFKERYWHDSYGYVFKRESIMNFLEFNLKKNIVFTTPYEMGIKGNNIYDDLKTVLNNISMSDIIRFA